ncbi:MAG: hypothetical protein ACR2RE_06765 [Geminicoccaceae bacterium]
MDKELAAQLIGLAIRGLISAIGVRAANELLDGVRQSMVDEGRGPTDEELDALFDRIQARSDRIQGA